MEEFNGSSPETASPEDRTDAAATDPIAPSAPDPANRSKGLGKILVANVVVYMIGVVILSILNSPPHGIDGGEIVTAMFFAFFPVVLLDIVILPFALFMPSLRKYRTGLLGCGVAAVVLALLGFLVLTVLSGID